MSVTTVTATTLTKDTGSVSTYSGLTSINTSNTGRVLYPKEGRLVFLLQSSNAATSLVFDASDYGINKQAVTVAATSGVEKVFVLSSNKVKQSDGYVTWSYAASSAGYVGCFVIPE
jgi:hypothetical protein